MEMSNSEPLKIGYAQTWDYHFTGSIDDLRIYDRALTSSEVTQLYLPKPRSNRTPPYPAIDYSGPVTGPVGCGLCKGQKVNALTLPNGPGPYTILPMNRNYDIKAFRDGDADQELDAGWQVGEPMLITEIGTAPQVVSTSLFGREQDRHREIFHGTTTATVLATTGTNTPPGRKETTARASPASDTVWSPTGPSTKPTARFSEVHRSTKSTEPSLASTRTPTPIGCPAKLGRPKVGRTTTLPSRSHPAERPVR